MLGGGLFAARWRVDKISGEFWCAGGGERNTLVGYDVRAAAGEYFDEESGILWWNWCAGGGRRISDRESGILWWRVDRDMTRIGYSGWWTKIRPNRVCGVGGGKRMCRRGVGYSLEVGEPRTTQVGCSV